MSDVTVYDKAKWHFDAKDYPPDLSQDQAYVHTGLFFGWLIETGLLSSELLADFPELATDFASRARTGPELFRVIDGALVEHDLSEQGNAFARDDFEFSRGRYLSDLDELLGGNLPTMYHIEDTWANYEILRSRLNERFAAW